MSSSLPFFSAEDLHKVLSFPALIDALREGFTQEYVVPPRMHVDYDAGEDQNTLLLMPAICSGAVAGVKIVNVAPGNAGQSMPTIQGIYYLMDAITGVPKALMEAKALTNWRTAAASALTASFLAQEEASSLLMIGTGALAPYLIEAHAAVRPIKTVWIYGRSPKKAEAVAKQCEAQFGRVEVVQNLEKAVQEADLISAATMSPTPLLKGAWLRAGQHVDLVGSFKPSMREADDEVIRRASVYVDTLEMAPKESGDLAIPLERGILTPAEIRGDLFQLCKGTTKGRQSETDITLFKSVGHALEDLVAAQLVLKLAGTVGTNT